MNFLRLTQKKKTWFTILSLFAGICSICVIVVSIHRANTLEYIYDLPEEELYAHLEEYTTSSIDVSTGNQISSHLQWLSGACKIGTISIQDATPFDITAVCRMGTVKLLFCSNPDQLTIWTVSDKSTLLLQPSSYDVYCIGKHFWGSVNITPAV